jgi:serine/threonine-protein kinase
MPPEQARGHWEEVDAKSDLWAVGAVMFAVLNGKPVHEGRTVNEQLLSAMTEPAPPVGQLNPYVADTVAAIVDRALEFDKRNRWPNASEMRAAVGAAYSVLTGKRISEAPALIAQLPPPISVDPTLATLDGDAIAPQGLQATTSRPVAGGPAHRAPSTALKVGAAVVTAAALATAFVLLSKAPREEDHAPKDGRESAASRLPRLEVHAPRDPSPEPPPAASVSAASSAAAAEAVHPVKAQRRAATSRAAPAAAVPSSPAATAPAPSAEVDIFTRRK